MEALVAAGISGCVDLRSWFKNLWLGSTCFPFGLERDALGLAARFLGIPSPLKTTVGVLFSLQILGREGNEKCFFSKSASLL